MIPAISNDNIEKVIACLDKYEEAGRWYSDTLTPLLNKLNDEERWLLSFMRYLLFMHRVFWNFDDSRYYTVPAAAEQAATFDDFLTVIRYYRRRRLRPKNEKVLIQFLNNCTQQFQDFYLGILTRQRMLQTFMKNAQDYTDEQLICPEEIFCLPEVPCSIPFKDQQFPLLVTTIPSRDLVPGLICRHRDGITHVYTLKDGKKTRLPKWLKQDAKLILLHTFVLVGLIDVEGGTFYPLDYYEHRALYTRHIKTGRADTPYEQRVRQLDDFLARHYLRQIRAVPKEHITSGEEIEGAVRRVLVGSPHTTLLFRAETARTITTIDALQVKGIIGEVLVEEGAAVGFIVWHNTVPIRCTYDFSGANNVLLYRPEVMIGKVVAFWLFVFDSFRSGTVKDILFEEQPFCSFKVTMRNGAEAYIEKCAYCAKDGSQVRLKYRGICYNTNCNWQSLMGNHGPDVWIAPSPRMLRNRKKTGWEPYMLNNVGFTYKGYKIICRESDGALMFKSDKKTMREYINLLNSNTNWANSMRERGIVKHTKPEDLQRRYQEKQDKRRAQNGAGSTAVSDLTA